MGFTDSHILPKGPEIEQYFKIIILFYAYQNPILTGSYISLVYWRAIHGKKILRNSASNNHVGVPLKHITGSRQNKLRK
jgi:hypothetical protein